VIGMEAFQNHVPAISFVASGGKATTGTSFAVAPRITGFSPTKGSFGTKVIISGANFAGAASGMFNGVPTTFTVNSPTRIMAFVFEGVT
jgi:hypothetical protein